MSACKVEFITENGQKIVLDFSVNDKGFVEYKPSFEPQITDPKFNLGLAGELCQIFIEAISGPQKDEITNDTTSEN